LSKKLMDAINYSKTYQIDDKCHNVSGLAKKKEV
jgi:hypothetical protein